MHCEFCKLFTKYCRDYNSSASNSSLRGKSRSLIDVGGDVGGDNKDNDENPSTRETQPSVNVNSDNRNDEQHDDNQKNNERASVGGGGVVESMQNSSLTSKDIAHTTIDRATNTAMMMSSESSKEFHHNDDEVGCWSSSSMASLSTTDSSIISRLLLSDTRYDAMIDDSASAHFTPSSSTSCPSSNIKPTSTVFDGRRLAAHRVKFNPCWHIDVHNSGDTAESKTNNDPPQMEPLSIVDKEIDSSTRASSTLASGGSAKALPRHPIHCPLTNCDSYSMPSEFCNHITIDHPSIDVARCAPGRVTNMTINHLLGGSVTCQRMFLVSDRIT